ncbi:hypothetical protein [Flexistipes sp.]|uniref:hypothetical protein n=1 Tax=Flexistipes sp. TaxID=3088135 RepID=UPI002E1D1193|nr:hypothetical protein [Flexistipes sp.]
MRLRIYTFIILMLFLFAGVSFAEDLTCEEQYNELQTILLNNTQNTEPTLLHTEVLCKDDDSTIVKVNGRFLYGKTFRLEKVVEQDIGKRYVFPYAKSNVR